MKMFLQKINAAHQLALFSSQGPQYLLSLRSLVYSIRMQKQQFRYSRNSSDVQLGKKMCTQINDEREIQASRNNGLKLKICFIK